MSASYAVQFTLQSRNVKVGPIPVSTTAAKTCPPSCPLFAGGCYAKGGPLGIMWAALSRAEPGQKYALPRGAMGQSLDWQGFADAVAALPDGQLWRHNQAGDLPGLGDIVDAVALESLALANRGKRGFTYTHKPVTTGPHGARNAKAIRAANDAGFTINLSADNLKEADELSATGVGPVVVILPESVQGPAPVTTPNGATVRPCPATYADVTCADCQWCAKQDRSWIVGFPAHGASRRKASAIASQ